SKRINFSLCGSYQTQCEGALISKNSSSVLHREINNKLSSKNIGNFILQYVHKKTNKMAIVHNKSHAYKNPKNSFEIKIKEIFNRFI
ncbi:YqaJ domain-containing protein, partial [Vespula maculifrons]